MFNKPATLDISSYSSRIKSDSDKHLFDEAANCAAIYALRASYILIWLSCVESLKRKFKEAAQRDATASKVVGKVKKAEDQERSVDRIILTEAQKYGFLSGPETQKLTAIYNARCIYGHPYENAPSTEDIVQAAATVVDLVLSKPTTLKKGYAQKLIANLTEDIAFLGHSQQAVEEFAVSTLEKIDSSVHSYFIKKYFRKAEVFFEDADLTIFTDRTVWFLSAFLENRDTSPFNDAEWHDLIISHPRTIIQIINFYPEVFQQIGAHGKDSVLEWIIANIKDHPKGLKVFELLVDSSQVEDHYRNRFNKLLETTEFSTIEASNLSLKFCVVRIIKELKSHDWYRQNPAISILRQYTREEFARLSSDDQIQLGRNIMQAADGRARAAIKYMESWRDQKLDLPEYLIRGMLLECFVNHKQEFRIKGAAQPSKSNWSIFGLSILVSGLPNTTFAQDVINDVVKTVAQSNEFGNFDDCDEEFNAALATLNCHNLFLPLVKTLNDGSAIPF